MGINTKCGELLEPLRQVVARVSRVELRHVRTNVKNCETGSFTVEVDVESASELEPLRAKVQEDEFDPELAEKRHPEFKPEISLKAMEVPEVDSNGISQSGTFFENVWENVNPSTTPHGEQLPTQ